MVSPVVYEIEHVSRYRYTLPVTSCALSLCLKPLHDDVQQLLAFDLTTFPSTSPTVEMDSFGNTKHILNIHQSTFLVEVTARSSVAVDYLSPPSDSLSIGTWEEIRSWRDSFDHWEFLNPSTFAHPSDVLDAFMYEAGVAPQDDPLRTVMRLSDALHDSFEYVPGITTVVSPIEHILELRQGVCQDFAHVMIAVCRGWGIPARYVSGYLYVKSQDNDFAVAAASHAWVECRLPGIGWTGFDPTNQCIADERHIRIGMGRDYQDVAPVRGIFTGGGVSELSVEVRVRKSQQQTS